MHAICILSAGLSKKLHFSQNTFDTTSTEQQGIRIAKLVQRRTRDRKVAGSNPDGSGGRILFSIVNLLC